jgi:hypothetical protein
VSWRGPTAPGNYPVSPPFCLGGGILLALYLLFAGKTPGVLVAAALCIALAGLAVRFAIVRLPHASP